MRFIIFSLPRCGSTTLARALNCYPGIRCALEPFIPENRTAKFGAISSADELDAALAGIWAEYNGIKHVWYPTGWPFGGGTLTLNRELLRHSDAKVIFLTRRNELLRIVSGEMSRQTEIWGDFTEEQRTWVRGFAYQPLTPRHIEQQMSAVAAALTELKDTLRESGASALEVQYEDIFAADVYLAERLRVLARLRDFVGAPEGYPALADYAAAELLNPVNSKLNLDQTYERIPNIDEIDRRFGSDESGWLFERNKECLLRAE
jgi:hypothetical protein